MRAPAGRRLRVLTIVDRLNTSGGEIVAHRVAKSLDATRFESIVCSTRASGARHVADLEDAGVRVLVLDRRSRVDFGRWIPLLQLLGREPVDVIHSHKFGSNIWAAGLAKLARVPVLVAHEHGGSDEDKPLRGFLDRALIGRSATVVLTTSDEDRRRLVDLERVDEAKVRWLPNGIPALPAGQGASVRRTLGLAPETPVVGTLCRLRPEKALELLVEATGVLASRFPELRTLIVGEGPERARLEELAGRLGVSENVVFPGAQPHGRIQDYLAAFDVAVSCSDLEGSPLAVIEFMAAGRAIVATAVGGLPQLIDDGVHGLLVPPRDAERLAAAIGGLLADATLRRELGERAQARQRQEFDLTAMVGRLQDLYETLYWSSKRGRREAFARTRGEGRAFGGG